MNFQLPRQFICGLCRSNLSRAKILDPRPFLIARNYTNDKEVAPWRVKMQRRKQFSGKNKSAQIRSNKPEQQSQNPMDRDLTFALCDAIRYIKAFEVGQSPDRIKYDLAVRFKTPRNATVIKNRLALPFLVANGNKVWVIAPPDSAGAKEASAAGAQRVGEDDILKEIQDGRIEFDRLICHTDSEAKLLKSGVAKFLGKRRIMPIARNGTLTKDVAKMVREIGGGVEYRERSGVIRFPIGHLHFTPEQLQQNIKTAMQIVSKDVEKTSSATYPKSIAEVVLSSTNAPGFTLNGEFRSPLSLSTAELSVN